MLRTLLLKEMHEVFISRRFMVTSLLLLVLIPVGLLVSLDDYRARLDAYQNAMQTYINTSEGKVNSSFRAQGFRPPSPLSVFVTGIEPVMPNKAITGNSNIYLPGIGVSVLSDVASLVSISNEATMSNPLSALFGKMDFLFSLSVILTVLAFVFTYSMITGEKEQGTLKQIAACPIERWRIIFAKMVGNFVLFILPFLISTLIGVILLNFSGTVSIADSEFSSGLVAILAVSIVFLLCMFALGTLVSASCHHSRSAILILFFIWIVTSFLIPRFSPLLAQKIRPVTSKEIVKKQIKAISEDIAIEHRSVEANIGAQVYASFGITQQDVHAIDYMSNGRVVYKMTEEKRDIINTAFFEAVVPVREEYTERIISEAGRIKQIYENEQNEQKILTQLLSRLSPVSCLTYILTAVASTGPDESEKFIREAERFQSEFKQEMYNLIYNPLSEQRINQKSISVPHMTNYHHATFGEAFGDTWIDLLLLALYTILFFAGAFVKFLRYDVR